MNGFVNVDGVWHYDRTIFVTNNNGIRSVLFYIAGGLNTVAEFTTKENLALAKLLQELVEVTQFNLMMASLDETIH